MLGRSCYVTQEKTNDSRNTWIQAAEAAAAAAQAFLKQAASVRAWYVEVFVRCILYYYDFTTTTVLRYEQHRWKEHLTLLVYIYTHA